MGRIDRDTMFLQVAQTVALRGTCERARVGAVLSRDGRIIGIGYNGAPPGMPHCIAPEVGCETDDHICTCGDCQVAPYEDRCKHAEGCERTVHAEANAIAFAARHGVAVEGAELWCTHAPCYVCAKLILSAGITTLHYIIPYRDQRGTQLLIDAGLAVMTHVPG